MEFFFWQHSKLRLLNSSFLYLMYEFIYIFALIKKTRLSICTDRHINKKTCFVYETTLRLKYPKFTFALHGARGKSRHFPNKVSTASQINSIPTDGTNVSNSMGSYNIEILSYNLLWHLTRPYVNLVEVEPVSDLVILIHKNAGRHSPYTCPYRTRRARHSIEL